MQNLERVVKMKKSDSVRNARSARRAKAKAPRANRKVDNVRRLQLVEGGRQGAKPRRRVSSPPARQSHAVPPEIRRRRRLATLVLVLLAAGLIAYILTGPILKVMDTRRNRAKAEAQLAEEQSRTQALQDKKELETTEEYLEGKARENGYVKPGEIPIIVLDGEDSEESSDAPDGGNTTSENQSPSP
ncbi:MAG: hypothetical protein A2W01_09780 [Candidatus Solincola sediminis]|nr:MAG: hypothetical protein A2W01_09780 [Candidatus Solincola sediminis]